VEIIVKSSAVSLVADGVAEIEIGEALPVAWVLMSKTVTEEGPA
jgi:hypothetical protein